METQGLVPLVQETAHYYGATVLAGQGFDILDKKHKFAQWVAEQGNVLILHAGDLDKSGYSVFTTLNDDIQAFVKELGGQMEVKRIALLEKQVVEFGLQSSPAPVGLNRGNHGKGFTSRVECQLESLDAPDIQGIIETAFKDELDMDLFSARMFAEKGLKKEALELLLYPS